MANSDDSEWEYEYDENATEDVYITLDLTTHIPPVLTRDKRSKTQKSTLRGSNKSLANAPGRTGQTEPVEADEGETPTQDDNAAAAAAAAAAAVAVAPSERMQIVELHGTKPLISYNNSFYSCQWATDLGTNIFLARPPADLDLGHAPLRSTPSFDILGTTSARLVAVPTTIRPRTEPAQHFPERQDRPLTGEQQYTTAEGDVIQQSETYGLRIELPSTASAARTSQAKFLENLSAIKARRGDRDAVPITNIKTYRPPEGWEAERQEWIEKETARSQRDKVEAAMRMSRLNRHPRYLHPDAPTPHRPTTVVDQGAHEDADPAAEADPDTGDAATTAAQDPPAGSPDIVLTSQIPRKRRTRGGPRGGAPSGKKLRQSLGLPEARRDREKRPRGRPRKNNPPASASTVEAGPSSARPQDTAEQADPGASPEVGGSSAQQDGAGDHNEQTGS